jgi:hypothetical protein
MKLKKLNKVTLDFLGFLLIAIQFGLWFNNSNAGVFMFLLLVVAYNQFREHEIDIWEREKLRHEAARAILTAVLKNVTIHKYEPTEKDLRKDADPVN